MAGDSVKNLIAETLVRRIEKAYKTGEKFKVIVVMPLLPGFEGSIDDPNAGVMKIQLYWEYNTISRGGNSMYEKLE